MPTPPPLLYLGLRRAFEACVRRLMGSVPLLGVLCAWRGTLEYFLESVFLVFSSAPGFPRWSFYAARGEHLWSFLGNGIPQLLQRNLKQMLFFTIKLKILAYFGGYGPRRGPGLESGGPKHRKGESVILEAFFVVLADVFLVHFQGRSQLAPRSI